MYFKRFWDEGRGDEFDDWGPSWWYLEMDSQGDTSRVVQRYAGGQVLRYDEKHWNDSYGELPDGGADLAEFAGYEIAAEEFEAAWALSALNRT
ncbi:MAG: hypothetical protein J0I12_34045 [Candidatus Eremiobacteraeota bacterium]|nr:hypothetical protein [Candidatus Eremiobacteraeota bacterium]